MKAIMVMYDSLRRDLLESYGCDWTKTPNFKRLADLSVQFENCYVEACHVCRREGSCIRAELTFSTGAGGRWSRLTTRCRNC